MSISLSTHRGQRFRSLTIFVLVLFSMYLVSCTAEIEATISPKTFCTDGEVEAFVNQFPSLAIEFGEEHPPEDVLERLKIDIPALNVVDRYVGDCLDFVVYDLSPSYELVVDNNACSGYRVYIRNSVGQ